MAISGGAISLFDSFLHLLPDSHTVFIQNHAEKFGGAIYLQKEFSPQSAAFQPCFMLLDLPSNMSAEAAKIELDFINNTATEAGDAIFGGYFDMCVAKLPSPRIS